MRLIDADKFEEFIRENCKDSLVDLWCELVRRQPTIEAVPVVHGEWVDDTGCLDSVRQYKCSNCGKKPIVNMNYVSILSDFCPNCGCCMKG